MLDASLSQRPHALFQQMDDGSKYVIDPLADLLLSVAAIIILAVIVILPTIPRHFSSHTDPVRNLHTLQKNTGFRLDGRTIEPFVATDQGLVIDGPSPRTIPVDRIFFDEYLTATLTTMRKADAVVVLMIEPKGFESAFQFEVIANRFGPRRIQQIRIDSECNFAKSARGARLCGEAVRRP